MRVNLLRITQSIRLDTDLYGQPWKVGIRIYT